MRHLFSSLAVTAMLVTPTTAAAHDFFLLPESFSPASPSHLLIRATVGSTFPTPEIVVPADRAESFIVRGAGAPKVQAAAAEAKSLPLHITGAARGMLVAAVKAKPRDVEYAEDRIPLILGEYRVAPAAAAAVERLTKPRTWKVSSRRFAKTMVCMQTCNGGASAAEPIDGTLEFVARGSSRDRFVLLSAGKALSNYPVDLVGPDGKREHLMTNVGGEVRLPSAAKGSLMLFAALLTPPEGSERFNLNLTSLTFAR